MLASTQLSHRPTDLQLELKYLKNQVYCNIKTVTSLNILMQRLNVIYKKIQAFFFSGFVYNFDACSHLQKIETITFHLRFYLHTAFI